MRTLSITRPDDWHVHFRDEALLQHTVPATATHFARALVMPNLKPALTTIPALEAYRQRIIMACPLNTFTPYMTLYLNEAVSPQSLYQLNAHPYLLGAKFYPAGATTHSEEGTLSLRELYPLLEIMQDQDLVLQLHGEATDGDVFFRESHFIQDTLTPLVRNFPTLRIVLEHISTQVAVDFVTKAPKTVTATITPHHLLYNRNHLFLGGLNPHFYCLPLLKQARDQRALQAAAISGNPKFFAGTDSAPHAVTDKESACGCAGIYSAPFAVALYAQCFESLSALSKLDPFLSQFGAQFYQLPRSLERIELIKQPQVIPNHLPFGKAYVVPIAAGTSIPWSVNESV